MDGSTQIPDWEHETTAKSKLPSQSSPRTRANQKQKQSLQTRLDNGMPPARRYLGLRRRTFLIVAACAILALLALIIGLAAGLSQRSHSYVE